VYGYYTQPSNKAITSTKTEQPAQEDQTTPKTPAKAKRTGKSDADKLSELAEKVKRWNTKKKRADNMLKKLAKKVKYYQKKINIKNS
jgi:predicted RNase H-like nuclease (RuvC/YqgF family)